MNPGNDFFVIVASSFVCVQRMRTDIVENIQIILTMILIKKTFDDRGIRGRR